VTLIIFLAVYPHANLAEIGRGPIGIRGSKGAIGLPGRPSDHDAPLCPPGRAGRSGYWAPDEVQELYSSKTIGMWGDWGSKEYCPRDSYVYGFDLKIVGNQGPGYKGMFDDSALNVLRLHCYGGSSQPDFRGPGVQGIRGAGSSVTSATQNWGNWGKRKFCPGYNNPVIGFDIKIEGYESGNAEGDHTAANDVDLYCKDGKMLIGDRMTTWGSWSPVLRCPKGMAVVGLQTRVEKDQRRGDDTALNGVKLLCAPYRMKW